MATVSMDILIDALFQAVLSEENKPLWSGIGELKTVFSKRKVP
jgi:hypothetical protein